MITRAKSNTPPSIPFRGVRLELTKEAAEGCFLECNRMRSRVSEGGHGNGMKWCWFGRACVTRRLILRNYTTLTSLPHYTALRHYCNYYTSLPLLPHYIVLRPLLHYTASPHLPNYADSLCLPHYTDSLLLLHYQLSPNLSYHPY